jgi:hypothetical protein
MTLPATKCADKGRDRGPNLSRRHLVPILCLHESDLLDAFRLRYRNYSEHGHIPSNAESLFYDKYDALPNCLTFGILWGTRMVGSIRACVYAPHLNWVTLPAREAYASAFREAVGERQVAIEWNRLVVDETFGRAPDLQMRLWACAAWFAVRYAPQIFLAGVRAPHIPYYRRLGFAVASAPRRYPGTTFEATLMGMDWDVHGGRLRKDRRFGRAFADEHSVQNVPERSMALFQTRFDALTDVVRDGTR